MDFSSNGKNEIFFVDGAESALSRTHKEAMTSASAHFIDCFRIRTEVDVYISKRSVLQTVGTSARAWHMQPSYDRDNSLVCVFVDPETDIKDNIISLAHEFIHAWQVDRGDLEGMNWKGEDLHELPYQLQPWEIEAHGNMEAIAEFFFTDTLPSNGQLNEIKRNTDIVFKEIQDSIKTERFKSAFKSVGKVAAGLGVAAATLLGV